MFLFPARPPPAPVRESTSPTGAPTSTPAPNPHPPAPPPPSRTPLWGLLSCSFPNPQAGRVSKFLAIYIPKIQHGDRQREKSHTPSPSLSLCLSLSLPLSLSLSIKPVCFPLNQNTTLRKMDFVMNEIRLLNLYKLLSPPPLNYRSSIEISCHDG